MMQTLAAWRTAAKHAHTAADVDDRQTMLKLMPCNAGHNTAAAAAAAVASGDDDDDIDHADDNA